MRSYSRVFHNQAIVIKIKLLCEIPFSLVRSPDVWFILPGCPLSVLKEPSQFPATAEWSLIHTWSSCCVCSFALIRCRAAGGYPQESLMPRFVTLYIILFHPRAVFSAVLMHSQINSLFQFILDPLAPALLILHTYSGFPNSDVSGDFSLSQQCCWAGTPVCAVSRVAVLLI